MANANKTLNKAKNSRKDEFYTRLEDIERELWHYDKYFKDSTVLCNCDDPYESNFFKYFAMNFNHLGLKKLIATCYDGSPIIGNELILFRDDEPKRHPYKVEITKVPDMNGDGVVDITDVEAFLRSKKAPIKKLKGNGDFRSTECVKLLKSADIIVTNPPFSLFREYVAQLFEYNKKFIIIGHQNALKYKEIFPLIKNNMLWLGYGFKGNVGFFKSVYADTAKASTHKEGLIRVSGITWFTNLETKKRHEKMDLFKRYSQQEYPKYINYDAIEVSRTENIPMDYSGKMGVPITFMDKYNPEQFELLGVSNINDGISGVGKIGKEWVELYHAQGGRGHITANMHSLVGINENGKAISYYTRLIIRNRNIQEV